MSLLRSHGTRYSETTPAASNYCFLFFLCLFREKRAFNAQRSKLQKAVVSDCFPLPCDTERAHGYFYIFILYSSFLIHIIPRFSRSIPSIPAVSRMNSFVTWKVLLHTIKTEFSSFPIYQRERPTLTGRSFFLWNPATSYSPRSSPTKYHRR